MQFENPKPPSAKTPMAGLEKNRSVLSTAVQWASRITSIALEMTVPPVLGVWIDHKLATGFTFLSIGAIVGLITGLMSLWELAKTMAEPKSSTRKK